jgi:alkanesulfonate monooxygenase SsuD/methylene tetrahydromethanopterin reductase-like flavin-dependent oxidoreductase (luciferase family)
MTRDGTRMYGPNAFKLGLFAMNCSGGLTMATPPNRWDASWKNNLQAARLADDAGIEFLLPIGRWLGYKGQTDTEGTSFETLTWASSLLAATEGICVFGTLHVAFVNPVFAAKQIVTADHVGSGRFGLNIVSGWNADEFSMFGVTLDEHSARYAYTEEWMSIVKRIWSESEPFDFNGTHFHLRGVVEKPKPYGDTRPMLVSAGNSPDGRAFAARHADCLFTTITDLATLASEIDTVRNVSRDVNVFASGHLICRPTQREAEEYYRYLVYECGDWEAAEHAAFIRTRNRKSAFDSMQMQQLKERLISGVGTYPVVGSYDAVAAMFAEMRAAGLDGIALGLVNYIDDLPALRDEVLPRMQRFGLRETA